jgi:hypothetical protein
VKSRACYTQCVFFVCLVEKRVYAYCGAGVFVSTHKSETTEASNNSSAESQLNSEVKPQILYCNRSRGL